MTSLADMENVIIANKKILNYVNMNVLCNGKLEKEVIVWKPVFVTNNHQKNGMTVRSQRIIYFSFTKHNKI